MARRLRGTPGLLAAMVVVILVAGLALPAASQPRPPVVITDLTPECSPLRSPIRLTVSGTYLGSGQGEVRIVGPDGRLIREQSFTATARGTWTVVLPLTPALDGYYGVFANDSFSSDSASFSAPCRNTRVVLDPPCSTARKATKLVVTAIDFDQPNYGRGYYGSVVYNGPKGAGGSGDPGVQRRQRIPVDGTGRFATDGSMGTLNAPFEVTPPPDDVKISVATRGDVVIGAAAQDLVVVWSPCPTTTPTTPTTTTTTSTTTTTTTSTTAPRPPPPGQPTTTTTTTAPGASPPAVVVNPPLGPPGFVAVASGSGFPPGTVGLVWSPGLGSATAVVAADGTFTTPVLVFPKDRLGPRSLVATAGSTTASAAFLVVPATAQPSASSVSQINRVRRFTQR